MGPFLKSKNKTSKMMLNLIISLIPIILFTTYKNGYIPYAHNKTDIFGLLYPLLFIFIGAITSLLIEFIYYKLIKRNKTYEIAYSIFPGLFLALILPLKTPIYVLCLGSVIASLSKIVFGGFGKNIFNPALIGYIFVVACYGTFFTTNYYFNLNEIDTISKATPLTNASMLTGIGTYKELVKPYGSLLNFFIGTIPGSLAETSALLCVLAFLYLTITKTIKWRIPLTYITTVFVITFGIGRLLGQGIYYPLFQILSGGLMFGAVFMATDPVTSPVTPIGQIFQGIFLGILTVVLRFIGVEGVATSILIMNMFVFILDKLGSTAKFNIIKCVPYIILVCILTIATIFTLASKKRIVDNKDPNFNIISKENVNDTTKYVVTQKGYGGNIKAEVIIQDNQIISVEIVSNNETKDKYKLVMDNNYIDKLIDSQSHIEDVDTISGATVTSTALKKLLINVMEDYN